MTAAATKRRVGQCHTPARAAVTGGRRWHTGSSPTGRPQTAVSSQALYVVQGAEQEASATAHRYRRNWWRSRVQAVGMESGIGSVTGCYCSRVHPARCRLFSLAVRFSTSTVLQRPLIICSRSAR